MTYREARRSKIIEFPNEKKQWNKINTKNYNSIFIELYIIQLYIIQYCSTFTLENKFENIYWNRTPYTWANDTEWILRYVVVNLLDLVWHSGKQTFVRIRERESDYHQTFQKQLFMLEVNRVTF